MKTTVQPRLAERVGRFVGRVWMKVLRLDRGAQAWLVAHGASADGANALLWIAKLVVLGGLLYATFWLALLLALAIVAAWIARNDNQDETLAPEWRNGSAGFGLYTYDGHRIDPHNSDGD